MITLLSTIKCLVNEYGVLPPKAIPAIYAAEEWDCPVEYLTQHAEAYFQAYVDAIMAGDSSYASDCWAIYNMYNQLIDITRNLI